MGVFHTYVNISKNLKRISDLRLAWYTEMFSSSFCSLESMCACFLRAVRNHTMNVLRSWKRPFGFDSKKFQNLSLDPYSQVILWRLLSMSSGLTAVAEKMIFTEVGKHFCVLLLPWNHSTLTVQYPSRQRQTYSRRASGAYNLVVSATGCVRFHWIADELTFCQHLSNYKEPKQLEGDRASNFKLPHSPCLRIRHARQPSSDSRLIHFMHEARIVRLCPCRSILVACSWICVCAYVSGRQSWMGYGWGTKASCIVHCIHR